MSKQETGGFSPFGDEYLERHPDQVQFVEEITLRINEIIGPALDKYGSFKNMPPDERKEIEEKLLAFNHISKPSGEDSDD